MKKINSFLMIMATLIMSTGCDDDSFDLPASEPLINPASTSVSTLPGGSINVSATITDPVGLQNIELSYPAWNVLDNQAIADAQTSLIYSIDVAVPTDADKGSSHDLTLSATNVNGVVIASTITIVLDQDVTAPTLELITPRGVAFLGDGDDLTIEISVVDDVSIRSFTIVGAQLSEKINVNTNKYTYSRALNFQSEGVYKFDVEVEDDGGNKTTQVFSFPAFEPFEKMYLADVDTDADLVSDVMGVPLLASGFIQEDSIGKVFRVNYFNSSLGTEVRFISNRETFGSLTLGADSNGNLLADNSASISPLVLDEIGYYEIILDTRDLTYSIESYTPNDATFDLVIMMGTGVRVNGSSTCESNVDGSELCWNFNSGKELAVDPTNPYRFTGTVELFDHDPTGDDNNGFILGANLSGWSPFWRFDDETEPDLAVPNGGTSFVFDESKYGTYQVVFDTHLNQLIMVRN